jgi:bla regulator protein BlaR1
MMTWLLTNIVLSAAVLLFCFFNPLSPHRLRFLACFIAITAWLIPWQLLQGLLILPAGMPATTDVGNNLPRLLAQMGREVSGNAIREPVVQIPYRDILVLLSIIGLVKAGRTLVSHFLWLDRIGSGARTAVDLRTRWPALFTGLPESLQVRIQDAVPGAFTSGITRPVIWLHTSLLAEPELESVLRHELMHARRRDNLYLALITLVSHVFWWNPLVHLLAGKAGRLLELSCDAACAQESGSYPRHLHTLVSKLSRNEFGLQHKAFVSGMSAAGSFNIERLKLLQRNHQMKFRHYISTATLACTAALTIGCVAAQSEDTAQDERYQQILEQRARGEQVGLSEADIRKGMEVYISNLEAAYTELKDRSEQVARQKETIEKQKIAIEQQKEAVEEQKRALEQVRVALEQEKEVLAARNEALQRQALELQSSVEALQVR